MSVEQLDYYFPFIVFGYGLMIFIVSSMPKLLKIGEEHFPPQFLQQLKAHRGLGLVCLFIGSLWSLQNLMV